jgi:predicted transposase/invertase (TIGR01784 family)
MVPISEVQNEIWAEMAREETLKIGRREGRQEGRRDGERTGIQKGIQNGRLETARNMLKNGMSLDDVLRFTGLSREQIAET